MLEQFIENLFLFCVFITVFGVPFLAACYGIEWLMNKMNWTDKFMKFWLGDDWDDNDNQKGVTV